jgi:glycosyltransferase involved in cell wall biosynthesis
VSLVVATYEWPEALAAVLASVRRQRVLPLEVVVADDGSKEPTRRLLEEEARTFPVPLRHVWHPDDGFRLAAIRNRATAAAAGAYILQIDGDMVLHPSFVGDHAAAARPGFIVGGSRALLDPETSARVLRGELVPGVLTPGIRHRENALRVPGLARIASWAASRRGIHAIRGGNMAFWKSDFVAANGYDEAFVGWGREDTELVLRLGHLGVRRRSLKLAGVAWHLHHRERSRDDLARNDELLRRAADGRTRCARGVDQYLAG